MSTSNGFVDKFVEGIEDVLTNTDSFLPKDKAIEVFTGDYEANRLHPSRKYEIDLNNKKGPLRNLYNTEGENKSVVFSYPLDLAQSFDSDATHFVQFNMYEVQSPNLRDQSRLSMLIRDHPTGEDSFAWVEGLTDEQLKKMGIDRPRELGYGSQNETHFLNSTAEVGKGMVKSRIEVLKKQGESSERTRSPNPTRTLRQKKYKSKDTCFLYMPHKINNLSLQSYDTPSLLFAAILGQSTKAMSSAVTNALNLKAGAAGDDLMTAVKSMGPVMMRKLIAAGDSVAGLIGIDTELEAAATQLLGQTINPRKELVYNTPELRTFEFSYEFYPRNLKESQMVEAIIKLFRFHSAPSLSDNGNFLIPPSIFTMKFYQRTSTEVTENPFLLKIRDCVLTEVNVDYTPNGTFSSFGNGAPVAITMSLTFKELDINVKDDILEGY